MTERVRADVGIVGGGMVGLACAEACAAAGRSVVLYERGEFLSQASGANAGLLTTSTRPLGPAHDFRCFCLGQFLERRAELERHAEMQMPGELSLAFEEEEVAEVAFWGTQEGRELLTPAGALRVQPGLGPGLRAACYTRVAGSINPFRLARHLARGARGHGVHLRLGEAVRGFDLGEGRGVTILAEGSQALVVHLVLAAGSWAQRVGKMLGRDIPVSPCHGQILITERRAPILRCTLDRPGTATVSWSYLRQTPDGGVLVGASKEMVGFEPRARRDLYSRILCSAAAIWPPAQFLPAIRSWSGLRPHSPDALPMIEALGDEGRVIVAVHHSSGVLSSLGTGRLVAELVGESSLSFDIGPFRLSRFPTGESATAAPAA